MSENQINRFDYFDFISGDPKGKENFASVFRDSSANLVKRFLESLMQYRDILRGIS